MCYDAFSRGERGSVDAWKKVVVSGAGSKVDGMVWPKHMELRPNCEAANRTQLPLSRLDSCKAVRVMGEARQPKLGFAKGYSTRKQRKDSEQKNWGLQ